MDVVRSIRDMKEISRRLRREGKVIGFVPTMGYLHEGHLSLIRESKRRCDVTVVSIFVNPTQFGPTEDYDRYPRDLERDMALSSSEGVDYLFVPEVAEMYPDGFCTYVEVTGDLTSTMCGRSRPTFFRGVTTVVTKLFNIVSPHLAFFGEKDFQQLQVVRRMVRDLNMDVEIIPVPTVRDKDGLALSSRNTYLSPDERRAATVLYKSLMAAKDMVESGERSAERIKGMIEEMIRSEPLARIDYIAVVDSESLRDVEEVGPGTLIALAVWIGEARLIDNIVLGR
jgi:pantoate--beta-alanine ligase